MAKPIVWYDQLVLHRLQVFLTKKKMIAYPMTIVAIGFFLVKVSEFELSLHFVNCTDN
jgi:hypothetical protein